MDGCNVTPPKPPTPKPSSQGQCSTTSHKKVVMAVMLVNMRPPPHEM